MIINLFCISFNLKKRKEKLLIQTVPLPWLRFYQHFNVNCAIFSIIFKLNNLIVLIIFYLVVELTNLHKKNYRKTQTNLHNFFYRKTQRAARN
jgi:hypothetical protein